MRCKFWLGCLVALSFISAELPVSAQAVYAGSQDHPRLSAGAGFSAFNMDWGPGVTFGPILWVDWHPPLIPDVLNGLSLEVEARDLSLHRGSANGPNGVKPILPRTDTIGGGLIYHVQQRGFVKFEPYVKALGSFGRIDFTSRNPDYTHDTRTVTSVGGGLDWHVAHRLTVRGDYEYQFWPSFLGGTLDPVGFTGGVLYNFSFGH
jgi:opacity protein-like surface antigen